MKNAIDGDSDGVQRDLARYVAREMDLDEQMAFEMRMAGDAELERQVGHVFAMDALVSEAAALGELSRRDVMSSVRRRSESGRRVWRPIIWTLAAASVVLAGVLGWVCRLPVVEDRVSVAVVGGPVNYREFLSGLNLDRDLAPAEATRGSMAPLSSAEDRVDRLVDLDRAAIAEALARPNREVRGLKFVVPVRSEVPVWVAVVGNYPDGTSTIYYPRPVLDVSAGRVPRDEATAAPTGIAGAQELPRLAPGSHVLPAPRVRSQGRQRRMGVVDFDSGFPVRRPYTRASVYVVVRQQPPTNATWERLCEQVAGDHTEEEVARLLREVIPGAVVHQFTVSR